MRTRVSLLALLIAACGNNGTAVPITGGVVPTPGTPSPAATSTAVQNPSSVPNTPPPPAVITVPDEPTEVEPSVTCDAELGDAGTALFSDLPIGSTPQLEGRVLYSWTTLEQAAELQAGGPLLSRTERSGQGPGHALEFLANGFYPASPDERALRDLLLTENFAKARYSWPQAWATRMGWPATEEGPAETYGNQLLRMVIKPEALWVFIDAARALVVANNEGFVAAASEALAHPERIAGVYFVRGLETGETRCGSGSFGPELSTTFREFIIMNPDMVAEWELGTPVVRDAVQTDIASLSQVFEGIRSCPVVDSIEQWGIDLVCEWNWAPPQDVFGQYAGRLALINSNYVPRAAQIAAIIETLESDLRGWEITVPATGETGATIGMPDGTVVVSASSNAGPDAPGSDAPGSDAPGSDAPGSDATGSDATGSDAPANDATVIDATGSDRTANVAAIPSASNGLSVRGSAP